MIPCRCANRIGGKTCFTRKSLAMRPDQYSEPRYMPRCPSCGARKWRVDTWRIKAAAQSKTKYIERPRSHGKSRIGMLIAALLAAGVQPWRLP